MPQEFQVLRCCDCEKFQVHHVKKAKKWQCKVCGLKQSLKRAFFIGSSCDCRVNVQKLNFQSGELEMKRKLYGSYDSTDEHDENHSLESRKDFDFSSENGWVDENDGLDENDWADENDWVDEDDGFDGDPSDILNSLYNGNSQNNFEDELPRKKQKCESYPESETVEEDTNFNQLTTNVENQKDFLFSSAFKCKEDKSSSKSFESANNIPSTQVDQKVESKKECDLVKDGEENLLSESAKSKSNSILKPTQGFQLILNEAKKQRTHLSYDLDF